MSEDKSFYIKMRRKLLKNIQKKRQSFFEEIEKNFPDKAIWTQTSFRDIKKVVIIGTSSRGGSSVFIEMLGQTPQLIKLRGEENGYLALNGYSFPFNKKNSDSLYKDDLNIGNRQLLEKDFLWDCGYPTANFRTDGDLEYNLTIHAMDLALRLPIQWPEIEDFDVSEIKRIVWDVKEELCNEFGWREGDYLDGDTYHLMLFKKMRQRWKSINPYYYDINLKKIGAMFPEVPAPAGPPGKFIIEEPPFITLEPWHHPTSQEIENKILILKTPSDNYRIPFIEKLFPNADIYLLHLTRNAAASVNGLIEGWKYDRGFFSHRLPEATLAIQGYSDVYAWGGNWWKYDLPPGWNNFVDKPLEDVCAFQWLSAHSAILEHIKRYKQKRQHYLQVRFEDIVASFKSRKKVFHDICSFIGIKYDRSLDLAITNMPVVMATSKPKKAAWKGENENRVRRVMDRPQIREMMLTLGYELDENAYI